MINLAKSEKALAATGEHWDKDPWLLCVANGVIDLRTGELRAGKPEDRITRQTDIPYDQDAESPRWQRFLHEIFNDDEELIDFIWRGSGYSLTGDTREQCLFICYGTGANGKTLFLRTLRAVLGPYATDTPFSTFELNNRSSISNDLAALYGSRLVTSSESGEFSRLNESRVKALTGKDPITARFLYQELFTFDPTHKIWLATNHKPRVIDDSYGFWRRIRLIPFLQEFKGQYDDQMLDDKLLQEAKGILAWAVRGCLEWQKRGLDPWSLQAWLKYRGHLRGWKQEKGVNQNANLTNFKFVWGDAPDDAVDMG